MVAKDEVAMEVGNETKKTPTKKSPKKKSPKKTTPGKKTPQKNTPNKKSPKKNTPAKKTPQKDATGEETKTTISETPKVKKRIIRKEKKIETVKPLIEAADIPKPLKAKLIKMLEHKNLPRNNSKFKRFMKDCCKAADDDLIDRVWEIIGKAWASEKKVHANGTGKKNAAVKAAVNGDTTSPKRKLEDSDAEEGNKKRKVEQTDQPEEKKGKQQKKLEVKKNKKEQQKEAKENKKQKRLVRKKLRKERQQKNKNVESVK